jgi:hypothetical protein
MWEIFVAERWDKVLAGQWGSVRCWVMVGRTRMWGSTGVFGRTVGGVVSLDSDKGAAGVRRRKNCARG